MFRVYDTQAGRLEEVAAERGGLLRLYVHGPARRVAGAGELRTLLIADLIRRNAEHRHDLTVLTTVMMPGGAEDGRAPVPGRALGADAAALNIRPAEQTVGASDGAGPPAGEVSPGEIVIEAQPGPADGRAAARHSVRVGPVAFTGADEAAEVPLSTLAENGLDQLAARLALMSVQHAEPVALTWDVLAEADRALLRWRGLVAEWAESPSRPMRADIAAQVADAFDSDLDTPAALRALRGLEIDPQVPPGSKFESFLHADQLLALDLPREIGRPRRG